LRDKDNPSKRAITNAVPRGHVLYVVPNLCDPRVMQRAVTMVFVELMSRLLGPERYAR
jgi:hypothetical protein